jgi:hypothetical protein
VIIGATLEGDRRVVKEFLRLGRNAVQESSAMWLE